MALERLSVNLGAPELAGGARLRPIKRLCASRRVCISSRSKGCVLSTVAGRQWTQSRLHDAGYVVDRNCQVCLDEPGTLLHRHALCPATVVTRRENAPSSVISAARNPSRSQRLFLERLLAPELAQELPPPLFELQLHWEQGEGGHFTGAVFSDGSGLHSKHGLGFTRFGACSIGPSFETLLAVYAALPGNLQSVLGSEVFAILALLRESLPPLDLFTDCELCVKHFTRGKVWSCAATRPWAGVWVKIWAILDGEPGLRIIKTKAHRSLAAARQEGREYEWHGNRKADLLAKRGAALHPCPPEILNAVQAYDERITNYAAHIAMLHSVLESRPDTTKKQDRLKRAQRNASIADSVVDSAIPPEEGGHIWWKVADHRWRCEICNLSAKEPKLAKKRLCGSPFGVKVQQAGRSQPPAMQHKLFQLAGYVFCWRCGRYSRERIRALAGPCEDKDPRGGYETIRRRLRAGRDPRTGVDLLQAPIPFQLVRTGEENRLFETCCWTRALAEAQASDTQQQQPSSSSHASDVRGILGAAFATIGLTDGLRRFSGKRTLVESSPSVQSDNAASIRGLAASVASYARSVIPAAQRTVATLGAFVSQSSRRRSRYRF